MLHDTSWAVDLYIILLPIYCMFLFIALLAYKYSIKLPSSLSQASTAKAQIDNQSQPHASQSQFNRAFWYLLSNFGLLEPCTRSNSVNKLILMSYIPILCLIILYANKIELYSHLGWFTMFIGPVYLLLYLFLRIYLFNKNREVRDKPQIDSIIEYTHEQIQNYEQPSNETDTHIIGGQQQREGLEGVQVCHTTMILMCTGAYCWVFYLTIDNYQNSLLKAMMIQLSVCVIADFIAIRSALFFVLAALLSNSKTFLSFISCDQRNWDSVKMSYVNDQNALRVDSLQIDKMVDPNKFGVAKKPRKTTNPAQLQESGKVHNQQRPTNLREGTKLHNNNQLISKTNKTEPRPTQTTNKTDTLKRNYLLIIDDHEAQLNKNRQYCQWIHRRNEHEQPSKATASQIESNKTEANHALRDNNCTDDVGRKMGGQIDSNSCQAMEEELRAEICEFQASQKSSKYYYIQRDHCSLSELELHRWSEYNKIKFAMHLQNKGLMLEGIPRKEGGGKCQQFVRELSTWYEQYRKKQSVHGIKNVQRSNSRKQSSSHMEISDELEPKTSKNSEISFNYEFRDMADHDRTPRTNNTSNIENHRPHAIEQIDQASQFTQQTRKTVRKTLPPIQASDHPVANRDVLKNRSGYFMDNEKRADKKRLR